MPSTRGVARGSRRIRVAYLRNPLPNDSRPGQRPQPSARGPSSGRTARKVRPPLSVFWRLPGVAEVRALLLPLSYFSPPQASPPVIGNPPRHGYPAHGGRSSRCRGRRSVRAARLLAKPGEHERRHTRLFAFKHPPSTGHDRVPTPEEVETGKMPRPEDQASRAATGTARSERSERIILHIKPTIHDPTAPKPRTQAENAPYDV